MNAGQKKYRLPGVLVFLLFLLNRICLNVAKAGGLQSQGVKVEIVVGYIDPLTTQDLKSSGFPDVLGRSSKSEAQRVNNMAKSDPSLEFTIGDILKNWAFTIVSGLITKH
jgi:hypothetical protein